MEASTPSTGDDSCKSSQHSPGSRGEICAEICETEFLPSEWTDEKHSQYLKSMETSFVNQLYDSMELLGRRSDKENLLDAQSRRHNKCIYSPSGQFKVLRDGCWKKINFERPSSVSNTCAKSHVILKSPWIQHFRSTSRPLGSASSDLGKVASPTEHRADAKGKNATNSFLDTKSKQHYVCPSYLLDQPVGGDNAEVSDQNFVDDDVEVLDQSGLCSEKRTDSPCNDQVVPLSELLPAETKPGRNIAPRPFHKYPPQAIKANRYLT